MSWIQEVSLWHWIVFARQGAVMPTERVKSLLSVGQPRHSCRPRALQLCRSMLGKSILWHQLTSPFALCALALANTHQRRMNRQTVLQAGWAGPRYLLGHAASGSLFALRLHFGSGGPGQSFRISCVRSSPAPKPNPEPAHALVLTGAAHAFGGHGAPGLIPMELLTQLASPQP